MIEIREYKAEDLAKMNIYNHKEFKYINLDSYSKALELMTDSWTVFYKNNPIFIAGIYAESNVKLGEGYFIIDKSLKANFSKIGIKLIKEIKKKMDGSGLDKIVCRCYNNSDESNKLLRLLGCKIKEEAIHDQWGEIINIYEYEVKK